MSAKEYMVRLYLDGFQQAQEPHILDVRNNDELASTLRQMVRAKRGDNRLDDREFSRYVIHVHAANGGNALWARCWLSSSGSVRVKR
jgi:hypothetical protein